MSWRVRVTIELRDMDKKEVANKAVFEHDGKESTIVNFFWAVVQHLRGWGMTEKTQ